MRRSATPNAAPKFRQAAPSGGGGSPDYQGPDMAQYQTQPGRGCVGTLWAAAKFIAFNRLSIYGYGVVTGLAIMGADKSNPSSSSAGLPDLDTSAIVESSGKLSPEQAKRNSKLLWQSISTAVSNHKDSQISGAPSDFQYRVNCSVFSCVVAMYGAHAITPDRLGDQVPNSEAASGRNYALAKIEKDLAGFAACFTSSSSVDQTAGKLSQFLELSGVNAEQFKSAFKKYYHPLP